MVADATIRREVIEELDFEPGIDARKITVTVCDAIVTLSGQVAEYREKLMAETAVFRLSGVVGIVQDLDIVPGDNKLIDDQLLTNRVLDQLRWSSFIPAESIEVNVKNGWVILQGKVKWQFQREAATDIISSLQGLRGVLNQISLLPSVCADTSKQEIEKALWRNACVRGTNLSISVERNSVTLKGGPVRSWLIRSAILQIVWSAAGVAQVIDCLQ